MNVEELRNYCLSKKGVTESFPFDSETLVFKVGRKMFALTSLEASEPSVNLKCEPNRALELRDHYIGVGPGFHMNKKHWNTVVLVADLSDTLIFELIDHSYELVMSKMTKVEREDLSSYKNGVIPRNG